MCNVAKHVGGSTAHNMLGAQNLTIPFGWCSTQSTCVRKVSSWSIAVRIRDATFNDGDFNPRSYADSVA